MFVWKELIAGAAVALILIIAEGPSVRAATSEAGRETRRGAMAPIHSIRRLQEPEPWINPMPAVVRTHPSFPWTPGGSISVGTVVDGVLVRGMEMPLLGPHHQVLDEHSRRATRWGTDEIVTGLLKAAAHVASLFPTAKMGVGNIARNGGGRLPWSISHHAGRDADIAFYLVDAHGVDVIPDTLLKLAPPLGQISTNSAN